MITKSFFWCLAVFIFLTAAAPAHALVVCARDDGTGHPRDKSKLILRASCRPGKEVSVGIELGGQAGVDGTVAFTGVNVTVDSGQLSTYPPGPNGLGNLILGYNVDSLATLVRNGSHNLVIGDDHEYTASGTLVAGFGNATTADGTAAVGGAGNVAGSVYSAITGGTGNETLASHSSISGGQNNTAGGGGACLCGGRDNSASGEFSSVTGGRTNQTTNDYASVSGGTQNIASGESSSISGGQSNQATGTGTSVTGGLNNQATNFYDSVTGGSDNTASGGASTISGGAVRSVSGLHDWRAGTAFEDN